MDAKTPAIHIYTLKPATFVLKYCVGAIHTWSYWFAVSLQGLFDADVVLSDKIQLFIKNTILDAYPISLRIDSVDFVTIIYSLGVMCYMILHHATVNRVKTENRNISVEDVITINQINTEYMLNNLFFWLLVFIVIFIVLEISCPVSIQCVSIFFSLSFTMLLYTMLVGRHTVGDFEKHCTLFLDHPSHGCHCAHKRIGARWFLHTFCQYNFRDILLHQCYWGKDDHH
jgi:hypothetical protein